jgi:hypothetical protein
VVSAANPLRLYSLLSRPETLIFPSSSSSFVLTRLSGPRRIDEYGDFRSLALVSGTKMVMLIVDSANWFFLSNRLRKPYSYGCIIKYIGAMQFAFKVEHYL